MWQYSGVPSANTALVPYLGVGDNIFLDIPPKATATSPASYNNFTYIIEPQHLPGPGWFHGCFSRASADTSDPLAVQVKKVHNKE